MIEKSLAQCGIFISQHFSLDWKKVIFSERRSLLFKLKRKQTPLSTPFISYGLESIEPLTGRHKHFVPSSLNRSLSSAFGYDLILVKLNLTFDAFFSSVNDAFSFIKKYFLLSHGEQKIEVEYNDISFSIPIVEVSNLSTPSREFKESFDWEDFEINVFLGGFSIITPILFEKEKKLILSYNFNLNVA